MATIIEVSKQSVKQLLESGKEHTFVIPEYQRGYAWTNEQIEILFEDLWDFVANETQGTYFLGSIVSYYNENGEQEIIDGQQRIISLFLLLRAIYTKLDSAEEKTKEAQNFINEIEPAIWRKDIFTGVVNYADILLVSRVVTDETNQILKNILMTGEVKEKATDNYSKNYLKFIELFEEKSRDNALEIYSFIYSLLNKAILWPISADIQDTALTIFSTLNNRGLPLSDADIYKSKIYNNLGKKEKIEFIEKWKELEGSATYCNESIQQLFYYYMLYLKAVGKDKKTALIGARKYYLESNSSKLNDPQLMVDLRLILNLWYVIDRREVVEGESWSKNKKIAQVLDTLSSYPNEYWKYPVVIYYLRHRTEKDFESKFLPFLRKQPVVLLTKYLESPTLTAVKADILKLNVEIMDSMAPKFDFKKVDYAKIETKIKKPSKNVVKMLLKIVAYNEQDNLLPEKWEIEHILPQKWQSNYFLDVNEKMVKEKIEHIGNKIPFEKKLNIAAGNGYFDKKKMYYESSKIACVNTISKATSTEWNFEDITERDIRVADTLKELINKWNNDYDNFSEVGFEAEEAPTEEEKLMIEKIKKKGWLSLVFDKLSD